MADIVSIQRLELADTLEESITSSKPLIPPFVLVDAPMGAGKTQFAFALQAALETGNSCTNDVNNTSTGSKVIYISLGTDSKTDIHQPIYHPYVTIAKLLDSVIFNETWGKRS